MVHTGERYRPTGSLDQLDASHITNYLFAEQFIEDKIVLDSGCGYGYGCDLLAKSGAKRIFGIDVSKEAMRFNKRYYNMANLDFIVMDVHNLAFKDGSFDVVVSFEVIEHILKTDQYTSEICRILKKDGSCIISTPNKQVSSPGVTKPIFPFHVHEFYANELYTLLNQYFKKVAILGKEISNNDKARQERKYRESLRFKVISRLSQYEPIRILAKILPLKVKHIFTGSGNTSLKACDFEFSNDVESSLSLLAICEK